MQRASRTNALLLGLTLFIFSAVFALRLWLGRGLPLWLDESWTGMIATQAEWHSFWREVWLDCNPPLYYVVMRGWTVLAGASDISLRLPSLIFMTCAAALPLVVRVPGLSRRAALCWALLLCLWRPGQDIAVDARGYGLLFLLSVGQGIAFVRLMAAPTRKSAALWSALASLAALTHYHALLIAGLQGLALLWRHRTAALRLWPASLAFVPAFGWLAVHAPRLADYARPDIAWYEPMTPALATNVVRYGLGLTGWTHSALLVLILATTLVFSRGKRAVPDCPAGHTALRWLVLASFAGLFIELALGSLRPMLTDRYLVPLVPGLLLGLVLAVQQFRAALIGYGALVLAFAVMLNPVSLRAKLEEKTNYGFAAASAFVRQQRPDHVIFIWDHPAAQILDPTSMAKLGGFFLKRDGQRLPVTAMVLPPSADGNRVLQSALPPQTGLIWIYNRARASSARRHPPTPTAWTERSCALEQGAYIGTFACGPKRR